MDFRSDGQTDKHVVNIDRVLQLALQSGVSEFNRLSRISFREDFKESWLIERLKRMGGFRR